MKLRFVAAILLIVLLLTGCSGRDKSSLRAGILPIEDALPIVVAKDEGIFDKYGLSVEVISFNSAHERDSALTTDAVDAVITDPLAVLLLKDRGYDVKIVSMCLGDKPDEGVFAILAAPNTDIKSVEDLNGKQIAISSGTIIEYVTDMLLSPYNISYEKVEVKKIPIRMRMLLDGKIDAATLPEPLASYAAAKGAKVIVSDSMLNESITQTVIVFRGDYLKENPDAVERFLNAYSEAVSRINSNPEKYREKFVEIARIPKELHSSYPIPHYPAPKPLPERYYERYVKWALEKGLISRAIEYSEVTYD